MKTLEYLQQIVEPSKFKRVPTLKAILESGAKPVESVKTSDGGWITVFDNGIVVCRHGMRITRLALHSISGDYTYSLNGTEEIFIPEEELLEMPWQAAAFLFAEQRVIHSQSNSKPQRKRVLIGLVPVEAFVEIPDDEGVLDQIIREETLEETKALIHYALSRVTKEQREILTEYFFNEKTQEEIAKERHSTQQSVSTTYIRGLARMRKAIEKKQAETEGK